MRPIIGAGWLDFGNVPEWIAALAAMGTLFVAASAAMAAFHQVNEARRLREEQARPFVVVDFDPNGVGHPFMDIVVKNYGTTLAENVVITFDPPLTSTLDNTSEAAPIAEWALFSQMIPTIPPGKEYRGLFDHMPDRFNCDDLPRRYIATVDLEGPTGKETTMQVLDLNLYYGVQMTRVHGVHHIAKTLRAWAQADGVRSF